MDVTHVSRVNNVNYLQKDSGERSAEKPKQVLLSQVQGKPATSILRCRRLTYMRHIHRSDIRDVTIRRKE
jgi:hypothetical protein